MGSDVPESPDIQTGDSDKSKGRRGGRHRRRGRRPRRRSQDRTDGNNAGNGNNEDFPPLTEDPEQLEAESRPLGLLEVLNSGSGFIRRRESSYTPGRDDIYVGSRIIQKFGLRTGDELMGVVSDQVRNGKSAPLAYLARVNDRMPDDLKRRPEFQRLSAMHPDSQLVLECGRTLRGQPDYTNRVIDLFCPFGKG
jgi:transcription termination factor Rho